MVALRLRERASARGIHRKSLGGIDTGGGSVEEEGDPSEEPVVTVTTLSTAPSRSLSLFRSLSLSMYIYSYIYIYIIYIYMHIYHLLKYVREHMARNIGGGGVGGRGGDPPEESEGIPEGGGEVGASSIHIGFGWPIAVLLTLPFSSVAVRLGPVLAGPVHSCVGAAGRSAAVCCVRGGCSEG